MKYNNKKVLNNSSNDGIAKREILHSHPAGPLVFFFKKFYPKQMLQVTQRTTRLQVTSRVQQQRTIEETAEAAASLWCLKRGVRES